MCKIIMDGPKFTNNKVRKIIHEEMERITITRDKMMMMMSMRKTRITA